jgi:hypothetical protein
MPKRPGDLGNIINWHEVPMRPLGPMRPPNPRHLTPDVIDRIMGAERSMPQRPMHNPFAQMPVRSDPFDNPEDGMVVGQGPGSGMRPDGQLNPAALGQLEGPGYGPMNPYGPLQQNPLVQRLLEMLRGMQRPNQPWGME